ncbi:MAG TPA: IS3 family transposase [Nitrospiraceae bacterium]
MRYRFMQGHQQAFRLIRMCQVLQVSRSGFYAWQHRAVSPRARANQTLMERMRILHQQTREAYGVRKMWHLLNREGLVGGRHRGRGCGDWLASWRCADSAMSGPCKSASTRRRPSPIA